jgi:cysteine desulfurase/selenocysteine lyase
MHKFEMATHSGPLLAGVNAAAELLRETGVDNISARIRLLTDRLIDGLQRINGVTIHGPLDPPLRTALVTFTVRDLDPNETCAALWQLRQVVGRVVNDKRVRLAVAAFNNEADIDTALEAVEHLAAYGLPSGAMTAQQFKDLIAEDDD